MYGIDGGGNGNGADVLAEIMRRLSEEPSRQEIYETIVEVCAGQELYIPHAMRRAIRNRKIFAEFDGTNAAKLCVKYNINITTLYRAIRKHRDTIKAQRVAREQ